MNSLTLILGAGVLWYLWQSGSLSSILGGGTQQIAVTSQNVNPTTGQTTTSTISLPAAWGGHVPVFPTGGMLQGLIAPPAGGIPASWLTDYNALSPTVQAQNAAWWATLTPAQQQVWLNSPVIQGV